MSKGGDGFARSTSSKEDQSSDDVHVEDFAATVADKWRGTAADKHDMAVLGRAQVLRVRTHQLPRQSMLTSWNCSGTLALYRSWGFPLC